jgi:hypothetical protein
MPRKTRTTNRGAKPGKTDAVKAAEADRARRAKEPVKPKHARGPQNVPPRDIGLDRQGGEQQRIQPEI